MVSVGGIRNHHNMERISKRLKYLSFFKWWITNNLINLTYLDITSTLPRHYLDIMSTFAGIGLNARTRPVIMLRKGRNPLAHYGN
jgi:hypothetical protein